ncbi:MAG: cyanophycinase [Bacteroidales bacterium]|nr:cyanophycinase [Bacteroidales bacterium]
MKNILFLSLLVLFCACNGPAERTAKETAAGSLFIIGGGSRPAEMVARMVHEAGLHNGGYAVILPMASALPDSAIIWSGEQFFAQGLEHITGYNFLPDEAPPSAWVDSLRTASLIYISGGDQSRFMEIVLNTPIYDAIHQAYQNGAVIAGTSAGAAVMSEKMITGNELRHPDYRSTFPVIESENLELATGLGLLTTAIIDQHFVWRSRHNRLITAVLEHPELPGIGIDESTAILVKGNKAEVVGEAQVLVFRNPGQSMSLYGEKMGGHGLRLDVFLPGESFFITK